MPVHASGLAAFCFMADRALHERIRFQIHERRIADQTFLFHIQLPRIRSLSPLYGLPHRFTSPYTTQQVLFRGGGEGPHPVRKPNEMAPPQKSIRACAEEIVIREVVCGE
jgi:hypothetical protein